mmetsp:Transcript_24181/g.35829  ORF Transcript_24181/g.35829 Transcript_24181/m.35829 type:complete len:175 (+) Transcript_24181:126-650(+)|eukprot:CAMPEP_0194249660 /NCGR_PEP_ID=MMETSP0158-20130606/21043_1 /TAXON_ID=33649 /ORGANISM="Thalassionema nitzschioides, Strain L26-B" /LENGTH=174 /DNA_ID=CAMNT_0038986223 /DNA_START=111 /DNA_END=635 /DNA_ORIENTATION=+
MEGKKILFVTVGTTRFDFLIEQITRLEALKWMKSSGYTDLIIQYGKGSKPTLPEDCPISYQLYDYKDTLEQDMDRADLILSHAGAGTIMEALRKKRRIVVVINTLLMNNHQQELANAMSSRGHLFVVKEPSDLSDIEIWDDFDSFIPIPHEEGDMFDFTKLLDRHLGISKSTRT